MQLVVAFCHTMKAVGCLWLIGYCHAKTETIAKVGHLKGNRNYHNLASQLLLVLDWPMAEITIMAVKA